MANKPYWVDSCPITVFDCSIKPLVALLENTNVITFTRNLDGHYSLTWYDSDNHCQGVSDPQLTKLLIKAQERIL